MIIESRAGFFSVLQQYNISVGDSRSLVDYIKAHKEDNEINTRIEPKEVITNAVKFGSTGVLDYYKKDKKLQEVIADKLISAIKFNIVNAYSIKWVLNLKSKKYEEYKTIIDPVKEYLTPENIAKLINSTNDIEILKILFEGNEILEISKEEILGLSDEVKAKLFGSNLEITQYLFDHLKITNQEVQDKILFPVLNKLSTDYSKKDSLKNYDKYKEKGIFAFLIRKDEFNQEKKLRFAIHNFFNVKLLENIGDNLYDQVVFLVDCFKVDYKGVTSFRGLSLLDIEQLEEFLENARNKLKSQNSNLTETQQNSLSEAINYVSDTYKELCLDWFDNVSIKQVQNYKELVLKRVQKLKEEGFNFNAECQDDLDLKYTNYFHYLFFYKATKKYTYSDNKCPENLISLLKAVIEETNEVDFNISKQDYNFSPLYWAASKGHKDLAIALIKKGADLNKSDYFYGGKYPHTALEFILEDNNYSAAEKYKLQKYANYYAKVHGKSQNIDDGQEVANDNSNVGKDAKTTIFKYLTEKKSQKTADFGIIHKIQRSAWSFIKDNLIFNWFKSLAAWVKPNNLFGKAKCKEHFKEKEKFRAACEKGDVNIENAHEYPYFVNKYKNRTISSLEIQ